MAPSNFKIGKFQNRLQILTNYTNIWRQLQWTSKEKGENEVAKVPPKKSPTKYGKNLLNDLFRRYMESKSSDNLETDIETEEEDTRPCNESIPEEHSVDLVPINNNNSEKNIETIEETKRNEVIFRECSVHLVRLNIDDFLKYSKKRSPDNAFGIGKRYPKRKRKKNEHPDIYYYK